ncbi:MAG TPA: gamma carbonic anhydrase family protein [Chthoniobacterales bacterium]|nr:gamma carbonic anhydrase family protein [Chthoniobacterales bacterium]
MMESHGVRGRLAEYLERPPRVAETAFVAPSATLVGAVSVGDHSSIWYQVVVRADIHSIQIGSRTNIQDGSILHVADQYPLLIGNEVTCGHGAIIHACSIGDRVLIGMGSIILDGAEVGPDCIVGAGALVTKGSKIAGRSLVIGSPARVVRTLTDDEIASIASLADKYVKVAAYHRDWLNQQKTRAGRDQNVE